MRISSGMRQIGGAFRHHLARPAIALSAVAAISAGGVGGLAYAITSGGPPVPAAAGTPTTSAPAAAGTVAQSAGTSTTKRAGIVRLLRVLGRAVHAEVVVPAKGGGYRTVDLDKGTITSLSSSSITIAPISGTSPVTAAITSSTHEPKNVTLSQGEKVVLISSSGDALAIAPMRTAATGSA